MGESELNRLLQVLASGSERAELVVANDAQLVAATERLLDWVSSEPELTDQHLDALANLAQTWRDQTLERLETLVAGSRTVSDLVSTMMSEESDQWSAILRGQANALEAMASSARTSAVLLDACAAIEARIGRDI